MKFIKRIAGVVALSAALLVGAGLSAQAGYVVTLEQQGPSVVATGSGPIDLTDLSLDGGGTIPVGLVPDLGNITTGTKFAPVNGYLGASGPSSFGGGSFGSFTEANSSSGDLAGMSHLVGGLRIVVVPQDYVSDSPLSNSATYLNQTFSSLGVTPGIYEWTWGSGPDQNFTLIIGAASVPEPSSFLMLGVALAVCWCAHVVAASMQGEIALSPEISNWGATKQRRINRPCGQRAIGASSCPGSWLKRA